MNLSTYFNRQWQKQFPNWNTKNVHLLLAVSGGVDSIVLVDLIKNAGFSFSIAHCNFQLRGSDSERDALFVSSLLGASEIYVKKFETIQFASEKKIAIQEAARNLRYEWFASLMVEIQSKQEKKLLLVTAHHADDNIETVLMNFFRGTGILGLKGILALQPERSLIRPLLNIRKEQLIQYAAQHQLEFVEDVSNKSDKYTRNYFRNKLIPEIQQVYPNVENNILDNIERFKDLSVIYEESITKKLQNLLEQKGSEIHIPILKLKKEKALHTIIWEISKDYNFSAAQTNEIVKILDADSGAYISSRTHQIIKHRNWLIIAPLSSTNVQIQMIEEGDTVIEFEQGMLLMKPFVQKQSQLDPDSFIAFVDANKLEFPLLLRRAKTGDYFYPLGMQKKKKISRFLIDLKLSKTQKESCWILESNKKILWVLGYRIDNRFKIKEDSEKLVQIQFVPKNFLSNQ